MNLRTHPLSDFLRFANVPPEQMRTRVGEEALYRLEKMQDMLGCLFGPQDTDADCRAKLATIKEMQSVLKNAAILDPDELQQTIEYASRYRAIRNALRP